MTDKTVEFYKHLIDMAVNLQQIAIIISVGIFFMLLCRPYLKDKKWASCIAGIFYAVLLSIIYLIPDSVTVFRGETFLLRVFGGFLILYAIDHRYVIQKLFLSLSFYTLSNCAILLTSEQSGFLSDVLYSNSYILSDIDRNMLAFYLIQIEYVLVMIFVLYTGIYFLHRVCSFYPEDLSLRDMSILSIPPLIQLISGFLYSDWYELYSNYGRLLIDSGNEETIKTLTWSNWYRFFGEALFLVFWMAFLWLYSDSIRATRERVRSAVLEEQIDSVTKQVAHTRKIYEEVSGMRHDMSHHIMVIRNLLRQDNVNEAIEYISHIEAELYSTRPGISTGHPVTDVVLSEMEHEATDAGLSFKCDFAFPTDDRIDAFDLSVILGNGLSNAIASCEPHGEITVNSYMRENAYLIEIKNHFLGSWVTDKNTGFPKSTSPGAHHGLGLLNIRHIAEKYHGKVVLSKEDGYAVLSVLLYKTASA